MLKTKLLVLDHPSPDDFDINDETQFRSAVLWLEDQKIRHYTIEDRDNLRNLKDPNWKKTFNEYQTNLGSPFVDGAPIEQLTWLLSLAIQYVYSDNAADYNMKAKEKMAKKTSAPNVVSTNPLDNLDFSSEAFKSRVSKLANLTCVGPHADSRVQLGAISTVIKNAPHPTPTGTTMESVESPADILNLLFVSDLRSLQTSINEALVAVQKVTANPKTDTTLGKVGF